MSHVNLRYCDEAGHEHEVTAAVFADYKYAVQGDMVTDTAIQQIINTGPSPCLQVPPPPPLTPRLADPDPDFPAVYSKSGKRKIKNLDYVRIPPQARPVIFKSICPTGQTPKGRSRRSGDNTFVCSLCGQSFKSRKSNVIRHIKKYHKERNSNSGDSCGLRYTAHDPPELKNLKPGGVYFVTRMLWETVGRTGLAALDRLAEVLVGHEKTRALKLPDEPVVRWNEQPSCGYINVSLKCDVRLIGGKDARLKDEGDSADVLLMENNSINIKKQPKEEQDEETQEEDETTNMEKVNFKGEMIDNDNNNDVAEQDYIKEFRQNKEEDEYDRYKVPNHIEGCHHHHRRHSHHQMFRDDFYYNSYQIPPHAREWLVEQRAEEGQLQFQVLQTREQMRHQLWLREQQQQEQLLQDQLSWDMQHQQQQPKLAEEHAGMQEQQDQEPTLMQKWEHDRNQEVMDHQDQLAGQDIKQEVEDDEDESQQLPQLSVEAVQEVLDEHSIADEDEDVESNDDIMENNNVDGSLHVDFASLRQLLLRDPRIESVVLVIRDHKTNSRNTITIM